MPHGVVSSTQEASTSAGGAHSDPKERAACLLEEAEDNGSVPASPILRLPMYPSECRPPNAPLMPRAVLPLHVIKSRHRTRRHFAVARPTPAVRYPPGMEDDYYGAGHLLDMHAGPQTPLFLLLATGPAPNLASDRA